MPADLLTSCSAFCSSLRSTCFNCMRRRNSVSGHVKPGSFWRLQVAIYHVGFLFFPPPLLFCGPQSMADMQELFGEFVHSVLCLEQTCSNILSFTREIMLTARSKSQHLERVFSTDGLFVLMWNSIIRIDKDGKQCNARAMR